MFDFLVASAEIGELRKRVVRNEEVLATLIAWLARELGQDNAIKLINMLGLVEIPVDTPPAVCPKCNHPHYNMEDSDFCRKEHPDGR